MESNYYVYTHTDPGTDEIVYIGKGCGGRAWDVTRSRGEHSDHQNWMNDLIEKGFIPSDWVDILHRGLTDKEARKRETDLIHSTGKTKFNRQSGENQHQAKLTNDQAIEIYNLVRIQGKKPVDIAKQFNVSKAAVYMIANGKQWRAITVGVRI